MSAPAYEFIHGDTVRTKSTHPYNYDAIRHFTTQVHGKVESAYCDRMQQWNYDKWRDCAKIMNDKYGSPHSWSLNNGPRVEEFLRLYYDEPELVLIDLVEFCNPSTGYAHFLFVFVRKIDPAEPLTPEPPPPPKRLTRGNVLFDSALGGMVSKIYR